MGMMCTVYTQSGFCVRDTTQGVTYCENHCLGNGFLCVYVVSLYGDRFCLVIALLIPDLEYFSSRVKHTRSQHILDLCMEIVIIGES